MDARLHRWVVSTFARRDLLRLGERRRGHAHSCPALLPDRRSGRAPAARTLAPIRRVGWKVPIKGPAWVTQRRGHTTSARRTYPARRRRRTIQLRLRLITRLLHRHVRRLPELTAKL